jgi:hypothetical protein
MSAQEILLKTLRIAAAVGILSSPLAMSSPAQADSGLCAVNSNSADEEWITSLKLGPNPSIATEQGVTYKDASVGSIGTFGAEQSYSIEMTINVDLAEQAQGDPAWEEDVFVWLDLNQDGVVDLTNENIFTGQQTSNLFTQVDPVNVPTVWQYTFTGNFTVPAGAFNGDVAGRAMLQYVEPGDSPILCNSDPQSFEPGVKAFEFGSTLDFKASITGGVDKTEVELADTGAGLPWASFWCGLAVSAIGAGIAMTSRKR